MSAADNNGNGEKVSYRFVANSLTTMAILVIGALIGYLLNTTVPRAELTRLVDAAAATHDTMNKRDDSQDFRLGELSAEITPIREDIAAIRAILERVEKEQRGQR